jgi:hypothetical protein
MSDHVEAKKVIEHCGVLIDTARQVAADLKNTIVESERLVQVSRDDRNQRLNMKNRSGTGLA